MRERIELLPHNFCVTAGAGAGKTTCLVRAYVNLLAGAEGRPPLRPERIAAITFTEKAAGEMRSRIQRELAQRARAKEPGRDWEGLLAAVEWAPISTIHSFCAALLREHGTHLGLDPDFAVLDEREFGELLAEAVAELWRAGLQEGDPALARVLAHHDLAGLTDLLMRLHAGLATQGVSADQARQATAQVHAEALAEGASLIDELEGLVETLAQGQADGSIKASAKFSVKVKQIIEEWDNTKLLLAESESRGAAAAALAGLFSNNWGKNYNVVRQAARDILEQIIDLDSLPAASALAEDLLALASRLAEAVEREMARRAALSFDHLLLLALRLLREHPAVLAELRRRYRGLLVDEFQDVNPVQGRLVMLLSGLEEPPGGEARPAVTGEEAPRLLLVGDRKQSIYAFRGADVGVFAGAREIFAGGAGELAALPENFRSNANLVDFFNNLFEQILSPPAAPGEFPELDLAFAGEDRQTPARPEAEAPAIQILDCRGLAAEESPLAAWREAEALALADHLAALIASGTPPGRMAMLFRKLTQVGVYEQALSRAGVPYYTVRGRGFYACREVADLELALRAVLEPGDDLALAGLLRSPLVGLSDEALLALCFDDEGRFRPLGRAVASGEPLPEWLGPEQGQRLEGARGLLGLLRPLARRLGPAELLECLVESRDLLPLWHATAGGEQRAANLRKLIEGARQPGQGGSVEDFARRLGELVASPPEDPQAPLLGEEAPVVRLMTVHQAKGLEFPVVVLPDLASPIRDRDDLGLGPGGVLAAAPWSPEQGKRLASPVRKRVKARARAVEQAEAARLFYVACTRARERLIFCLGGASDKHQGQWGRWVRDLVLSHPAATVLEPEGGRSQAGPRPAPVAAWPEGLPPEPGPLAAEGESLAQRVLDGRPLPVARVAESVSGMENWLECPRLWFFTRRLGLDTASLGGGPGQGAGQSAELGSLAHRLLELADLGQGPAGLTAVLPAAARESAAGEALAREALSLARGLWDTPLPDWIEGLSPAELRREEPFHLYLDGEGRGPAVELAGEFDLLATRPGGGWLVCDYKVSAKVEPEKYRAQMALYALALWQGQDRAGPLPRMCLCYLTPQGGRLAELAFSAEDLARWRELVLAAGRAMAALAPGARALDLPAGAHCRREGCALGRAGLCPGRP